MKYFLGFLLLVGFACNDKTEPSGPSSPRPKILTDSNKGVAQPRNPYVEVDVSPMDMSYLPADYPKLLVKKPLPVARVIYSRPHKQGRVIFGNLIKYGEPWRLGANEATEIEFFQPATIQGKNISRGKYIIYSIPHENEWTIVLNTNLNSWGLNLDSTKDVHRFTIPVQKKDQSVEFFSMIFQATDAGADLVIGWDSVEARLPIQYREQ
jgi:hypothetical protein